jgi:hypothetical protein
MLDEHLSTESRSLQGRDGRGLLDERVMRFQNQNTNADAGPSTGANATVAKGQQEGDKKRRRSTRIKESNDTDVEREWPVVRETGDSTTFTQLEGINRLRMTPASPTPLSRPRPYSRRHLNLLGSTMCLSNSS